MNIYPYAYRLDNPSSGEFYIGFRCGNKVPAELDLGIKYFTSSRYVKPRFKEFEITILAEFFTKEAAYDFEQSCIIENRYMPGILNKHFVVNGTKRFIAAGSFSALHRRRISESHADCTKENNSFWGKTHTEESKKKIGSRDYSTMSRAIIIDGIKYRSEGEANSALNIPRGIIGRLLNNGKTHEKYKISAKYAEV